MRVSFRATIGTDDNNTGTQVLDEVPASSSDSEEIHVIIDVAENVKSCVMLEEQVHFNTDAANVLEHIRELHMLGVRAEAIEAGKKISSTR
jgi:hypothetical protein